MNLNPHQGVMTNKIVNADRFIIDAYSRPIEQTIYGLMIPKIIKDIIYQYCDPWWNNLDPSPIKITHFNYYSSGTPDLLCYYSISSQKERIILPSFANDSPFVYEYDIKNDKFIKLCKYPTNFAPQRHGQVIDEKNESLYIFFGRNDNFGILNLINNKWDIKLYNNNNFNIHNVPHNVNNPTACFVESQLHILNRIKWDTTDHYYYKSDEQIFIRIDSSDIGIHGIGGRKMVYVQKINKLLLIGRNKGNNDVCYCDIIKDATTKYLCNNYKWKIFNPLKCPFEVTKPKCIVAMNAILLILKDRETAIYDQGEIWWVDIGDETENEYKWIKCDICIKKPRSKKMVITSNNYIHFIDFYSDQDGIDPNNHSKIHLSHLIPHDILIKYL